MKKIYLLLFTVFLTTTFFSCNPTSLVEDELIEQQAKDCCDGEGDIPPGETDPPGDTSGDDDTTDNDNCCDGEGDIPPTP